VSMSALGTIAVTACLGFRLRHKGRLYLIGGRGGDSEAHKEIVREFSNLCDGDILIVSAASDHQDAGQKYFDAFSGMGNKVKLVRVPTKQEILDPKLSGIFFTGGNQSKLMDRVGHLKKEIKRRYNNGVHLGGTSAGTAVMGETMIAGEKGDEGPIIKQGFGIIRDSIFDQHFSSRNRVPRLTKAVESLSLRGVGIDEDTAFVYLEDNTTKVIGSSKVTIIDPKGF
jgi:cyanophycinase